MSPKDILEIRHQHHSKLEPHDTPLTGLYVVFPMLGGGSVWRELQMVHILVAGQFTKVLNRSLQYAQMIGNPISLFISQNKHRVG